MDGWTEENTIRLEIAVSRCGRNWVAIAADTRLGLNNFNPDALRKKYNSMSEVDEWNFSDVSSEEEQEMVDYLDVSSYINGPSDYDNLSDDDDYIPNVTELPAVYEDQDWWLEWWDTEDPDYTPSVTELPALPAVVEGKYSLRRRVENPRKSAVYVAPPNIHELRKPQIPMKWNEDYYKEFARAISIHGHNWSKMTTDSTIGLPSNLKGPNLKDKWRAMNVDNTMWSSSEDDSDSDEFSGEEDNGYVHYLLHPSPFLDEDEDDEVEQNPIQPGFSSFTAPDFQYKWGSNFEVGSSSNPPRKTPRRPPSNPPRKTPRRPPSISIPHPIPTLNTPPANPSIFLPALLPPVPKRRRTHRVWINPPPPANPPIFLPQNHPAALLPPVPKRRRSKRVWMRNPPPPEEP